MAGRESFTTPMKHPSSPWTQPYIAAFSLLVASANANVVFCACRYVEHVLGLSRVAGGGFMR